MGVPSLDSPCEAYLARRFEIEKCDLSRAPQRALADRVAMTPKLIHLETHIILTAIEIKAAPP